MTTIDSIREAGIVGAGGAGFPTHVTVNRKAEYVIANGAECEPILRVDQQIMAVYADKVVKGMMAIKEQTGAQHAVIGLKEMCIRDREMKKTYTILAPAMAPIHFRMIEQIFREHGYHLKILYTTHRGIVETGLQNVHNDTCYPALLVVWQLL